MLQVRESSGQKGKGQRKEGRSETKQEEEGNARENGTPRRVWSGCGGGGVSIPGVFGSLVLGGSVMALVGVRTISTYRVLPMRSPSPDCCLRGPQVPSAVLLRRVLCISVIARVRSMCPPASLRRAAHISP
ncbi:unnamed protein product [Boreogadus saida]